MSSTNDEIMLEQYQAGRISRDEMRRHGWLLQDKAPEDYFEQPRGGYGTWMCYAAHGLVFVTGTPEELRERGLVVLAAAERFAACYAEPVIMGSLRYRY